MCLEILLCIERSVIIPCSLQKSSRARTRTYSLTLLKNLRMKYTLMISLESCLASMTNSWSVISLASSIRKRPKLPKHLLLLKIFPLGTWPHSPYRIWRVSSGLTVLWSFASLAPSSRWLSSRYSYHSKYLTCNFFHFIHRRSELRLLINSMEMKLWKFLFSPPLWVVWALP